MIADEDTDKSAEFYRPWSIRSFHMVSFLVGLDQQEFNWTCRMGSGMAYSAVLFTRIKQALPSFVFYFRSGSKIVQKI